MKCEAYDPDGEKLASASGAANNSGSDKVERNSCTMKLLSEIDTSRTEVRFEYK